MRNISANPWIWLILASGFLNVALADAREAEAVVRQATRDIYQALEQQARPLPSQPDHLFRLVDQILVPHADFERMSQWILGKYWRQASDDQRQQFIEQFRLLLVRTYSTAIQSVSLQDIHYLPQREALSPDKAVVRTEVRPSDSPALPIDYLMHNRNGRWLVYDVRIEGISLVTNYRTDFSAQIQQNGVQGLIDSLRQKNSASTGNAPGGRPE